MNAPLIFMDTETTGLSLEDDIWEFAAIRRETDGTETELHLFIEHAPWKCRELPESFKADHVSRYNPSAAYTPGAAARMIWEFTRYPGGDRPHIVGAVPNFDTERLSLLLRRYGHSPGWHYHLIDVENLAVGWLAGQYAADNGPTSLPSLPWDSDMLSAAVGVPPTTEGRHTAMGDVRWVRDIYDAVMGTGPAVDLPAEDTTRYDNDQPLDGWPETAVPGGAA